MTGNVFESNNNNAMKIVNTTNNPTVSITDNLYYEPSTGFTTGSFSGFIFSNNINISTSPNLYNAGKHFGGTQGLNRWSYQLYNGSSYSDLTYDSTN